MPKNLYKTSLDGERNGGIGLAGAAAAAAGEVPGDEEEEHLHVNQDMYKAVEVKPGECFEVVLKNNDLKSVLTWDFDVLNKDVKFTMFRTMGLAAASNKEAHRQRTASSKLTVLEENKLIEEGVDFVKEEPPLLCRPKESVQGSHVMDTNGTYILQWQCPEDGPGTKSGNAQLLYYYEVLSSESYRGSMTSLQSGFSQMSAASSCQSR